MQITRGITITATGEDTIRFVHLLKRLIDYYELGGVDENNKPLKKWGKNYLTGEEE